VDPSYFSIPGDLKLRGPMQSLQVVAESFDLAFILSSFWGMVLVMLIIDGTIIVIVSFIVLFMLDVVLLLASVFNPVARIFVADNVVQIPIIPISLSATLFRGSEIAG
jgi:hypothetical protein